MNRTTATEDKALAWVTGELSNSTDALTTDYIRCEEGQEFISNYKAQRMFYDKNKTYLGCMHNDGTISKTSGNEKDNVTVPSGYGIYYMRWGFRSAQNDNADMTEANIELELGTEVGTYIQHASQTYPINLGSIELCKIGDYQDYIYRSQGKWYKHAEIEKVTLSSATVSMGTNNVFYFAKNDRATTEATTQVVYCNKLFFVENYDRLSNAQNNMVNNQIAVNNNGSSKNIFIKNTSCSTKSDFDTWLSTEQPILYYQLATSSDTEITDNTLLTQLEAIHTAYTYQNETLITQTNADLPFILEIMWEVQE